MLSAPAASLPISTHTPPRLSGVSCPAANQNTGGDALQTCRPLARDEMEDRLSADRAGEASPSRPVGHSGLVAVI